MNIGERKSKNGTSLTATLILFGKHGLTLAVAFAILLQQAAALLLDVM